MKTELENKEEMGTNQEKAFAPRLRWVVFCFSTIIIVLTSGYYFFALRLQELVTEQQSIKKILNLTQEELQANQAHLKILTSFHENAQQVQFKEEGFNELLNLAKLVENSLVARDFLAVNLLLNRLGKLLENSSLELAKKALSRDYEKIELYKQDLYFKIGSQLTLLESQLDETASIFNNTQVIPEIVKEKPSIAKEGKWHFNIMKAVEKLFIVEKVNAKFVLPSERAVGLLSSKLAVQEVKKAWLCDDIEAFKGSLEMLRKNLEQLLLDNSKKEEIFKIINQLSTLKMPKVPTLEVVSFIINEVK